MSLSKCYQNVLTYESVKLMKRPVSMNTLMKVLRLTHLILIMRWYSHDLCKLKLMFTKKEWGKPQMTNLKKWMIQKVLG